MTSSTALAGVEHSADHAGLLSRPGAVGLEPDRTPALVVVDMLGRTSGLLDVVNRPTEQLGKNLCPNSLFEMGDDIADLGRIELVAGAVILKLPIEGGQLALKALNLIRQQPVLFRFIPTSLGADLVEHAEGDKKNQITIVRPEVDLVQYGRHELAIRVADLRPAANLHLTFLGGNPPQSFQFGQAGVRLDDLQRAHGRSPMTTTGPEPEANQDQGLVNSSLDPERLTIRKRGVLPAPPSTQILNTIGAGHPSALPQGTVTGSFRRLLGGTYDYTTVQPDGSFKVGTGLRWVELLKAFDDAALAYAASQKKLRARVRPRPAT